MERMNPADQALLDQLEAALAHGPRADAADGSVDQLVGDLQATAPVLDPGFATVLEDRVAARFVRPDQTPNRRPAGRLRLRARWPRRAGRGWLPIAVPGLAAAAVIAGAVVIVNRPSITKHPDALTTTAAPPVRTAPTPLDETVAPASASATQGATQAGAATAAPEVTATGKVAPQSSAASRSPRAVDRSARITVSMPASRIGSAVTKAGTIAVAEGGFVQSSQYDQSSGAGSASVELSVPSANLQATLTALGKMGRVASVEQSAQDITAQTTDASTQVASLLAQQAVLQARLAGSVTHADRLRIQSQIAQLDVRVSQQRAQLSALQAQAAMSVIDLSINVPPNASVSASPVSPAGSGTHHHRWGIQDALREVRETVIVIAAILLVAGAALIPLGLLIWLGVAIARARRRRAREAALDD